jgi:CBS domain-containing protein
MADSSHTLDSRLKAIRIAIRQLTAEVGLPQATIIGDVVQAWQQTRIGSTIGSWAGGNSNNGGPTMKVKDAMHKGVDWVGSETPVSELAKLMRDHDVGSIPIGEDDRLVGMVTDRDIVCKGLAQDDFDPGRATARDVMTAEIHCCREDDDLAKAVRHMEELKIRRLPVINKSKRMVGILSLGDVSHSATVEVLTECVKSVAAHHH